MAEEDINPNPNADDGEEEENEEAAEESQKILDDLTQFNDGDTNLDDVEDQVDGVDGADEEGAEPSLSLSMSSLHTGSQLTDAELTAGLPPAGEVVIPRSEISALQEETDDTDLLIDADGEEPAPQREGDEPGGPGVGFADEGRADAAAAQAEEEQQEEEPRREGEQQDENNEELILGAQAPTEPVVPTVASVPTEASVPSEATVPTVPTTPTVPTEPPVTIEPTVTADLGEPVLTGGAPEPVAYWNMDETSGRTLNDQIGDNDGHAMGEKSGSGSGFESSNLKDMDDDSNIHGSGSGAGEHSSVTADLNTGVEFDDNQEDFIQVDHSADLKPESGSLTLWFNSDEYDGTLASSDSSGYDDGGHFNLRLTSSGELELRMQDEDSSHTISGGDISTGDWNQVTVTWGEGGMKIFQNGELVASDPSYTGGLQGNENPWTFGAGQTGSSNNSVNGASDFFDGHLDDVAIFDEPLTAEQVQDLYEQGVEDFMDGGEADTLTYPLNITANLTDTDGSETLSIMLDGLPDGAVLSAGTDNGDGTFTLTNEDLDGLEISVPSDTGDFGVGVTATTTEEDGSTNSVTTFAGVDNSSSDTSFEQLDDGGDTFDNDFNSTSEEIIVGGDGNDTVWTGDGDDTIEGGAGNDVLSGEDGDDTLIGGAGDDTLVGGDGNDTIEGGAGDDEAFGGQGDDLFIFGAGDGADYFDGGNGWSDTIQLEGVDGGPGGDSGWTLQLDNGDTYTAGEDSIDFGGEVSGKIELADGSELTFEGVEKLEW